MSTKRQGQLDDWLGAKQSKKTKGSKGKYLVGVKGYFAEIAEESSYGELEVYVDGVEFIYSSGPSTKCGDCTGRNTSELISIEKGEHIVGVDFAELYDEDEDSYEDEVSADGSAIEAFRTSHLNLYTTCTTTRWVGRVISLYSRDGKPNAGVGSGPFVGLYDQSRAGEKFTCDRGMRVTGIVFEDGMIIGTIEDTIPKGENDKWWESHCGYKPWENLKFSLDPNAPYKYLAGARGYFNEDQKYCDDGCVIGVELIYSDGTSTKCGNCTGKRISEIIPFEKDEHIIGIDFEQPFPPGINHLTLYTSHPSGRKVEFCVGEYEDEAWADDDKGPYIGVHRAVGMVSRSGKRFTCKRGKRVTGIEWDHDGKSIKLMKQEKIPEGQNDKWWQKSLGYKKKASASKDKPYAVGVKLCTAEKEGVGRIVGLELELSDGFLLQWGREGTKESGQMSFEKNEHIIGIDFDADDDGVTSLELFTSNFEGRSLNFSVRDNGDVKSYEDFGCYVGVYGNSSLSRKEKKFTCERGNRVTGLTFAKYTITNMKQEKIPEGCNERWWERSMDYDSDRDPEKKNKRASKSGKKPKKTKGSGSLSDESDCDKAKHNHIMAEVKRQHRLVMAGYECEYDSEGNYNPTDYHSYGHPNGFSSRDCDDLLAQGVKPWDVDADNVLSAMRGRW